MHGQGGDGSLRQAPHADTGQISQVQREGVRQQYTKRDRIGEKDKDGQRQKESDKETDRDLKGRGIAGQKK